MNWNSVWLCYESLWLRAKFWMIQYAAQQPHSPQKPTHISPEHHPLKNRVETKLNVQYCFDKRSEIFPRQSAHTGARYKMFYDFYFIFFLLAQEIQWVSCVWGGLLAWQCTSSLTRLPRCRCSIVPSGFSLTLPSIRRRIEIAIDAR